jgi:predicted DNA binding CopG/RHH family protein
MRKTASFEDAPQGKVTIIEDFLPPPSQLVRKEETIRVTSEFTRSSIEYLKKEARKANVPYQRMLRSLVDKYVEQHNPEQRH